MQSTEDATERNKEHATQDLVETICSIVNRIVLHSTFQSVQEEAHKRSNDKYKKNSQSQSISNIAYRESVRHYKRIKSTPAKIKLRAKRAYTGIEPVTSRTLSENHTTRPAGHCQLSTIDPYIRCTTLSAQIIPL